jgi:hypothetical protein
LEVKQVLILVVLPREPLLLPQLIELIKHDIFVFRWLFIIDSLVKLFVPQGILEEKRLFERVFKIFGACLPLGSGFRVYFRGESAGFKLLLDLVKTALFNAFLIFLALLQDKIGSLSRFPGNWGIHFLFSLNN